MDYDRARALRFLQEKGEVHAEHEQPKPEPDKTVVKTLGESDKKPRKKPNYIGAAVIVVIAGLVFSYIFWETYDYYQWKDEMLDYAKTLDIDVPENATVVYGTYLKELREGWYSVQVRFYMENPWEDYIAKLWFNRDTGDYVLRSD